MPQTAAFSSRSSRFNGSSGAMLGPVPGAYEVNYHDMATQAVRAGGTPRRASWGGTQSRDMPWQKNSERQAERVESDSENKPVRSTFGSSAQASVPSAAFSGSGDRFYKPSQGTPGPGAYSERVPLSPSNRMNRSSSFGSKTKRFVAPKSDTPAPGQFDAKPSAFSSGSQRSRAGSSAFGSRSARGSPFEVKHTEDAPPPPGAYDHSSGAFATPRAGRSASPSAGFRSGSSRFVKANEGEGAAPGTYEGHDYHAMARNAGKSFNKASANGTGGFGTSARRSEVAKAADGPGPAAYDASEAVGGRKSEARPSSAFASKTKGGEAHIRRSESPGGASTYDPHKATGIAASSSRTFNRLAGSGRGAVGRSERASNGTSVASEAPGPGAYGIADPNRPSCERQASSSRGKASSWAVSSTTRDPFTWHERAKPTDTPGPGQYANADPTRSNAYVKE